MAITKLKFYNLIPNIEDYKELFIQSNQKTKASLLLNNTQPRLCYALKQLLANFDSYSFMLLKAPEEASYLNLIAHTINQLYANSKVIFGGKYHISDNMITFEPSTCVDGQFSVNGSVITADWMDAEQLFGCLRQFNGIITIHPGLIHRANGGVLVILLRTLLAKPLLWIRLKTIITHQRFDWMGFDESHPLPLEVPSMPLLVKVVLIGNRESLAIFQKIESETAESILYSEFEENIQITNKEDMAIWCNWVRDFAYHFKLPTPTTDAWPVLIQEAMRYTGDRELLPLSPIWLDKQIREVLTISGQQKFTGEQLVEMLKKRKWREGFLAERMKSDILSRQILVETEGERVGQINALSVIELPGYPHVFGEPSRISCVVYIGDGEFTNIEHKTELDDNIHNKGMMIIRAFLMAQLQLKQQNPFSASLAFEQSYSVIDGDSASMAELCVLISALADVPINQSIAITGSVDQFGRAQPVGSLNEKIESFFYICRHRKLTGKQGVIIPVANIRHLSLNHDLLMAIQEEQFAIWAIEDVTDALFLLTNLFWNSEEENALIKIIQKRMLKIAQQNTKYVLPSWLLSWLKWFN